MQIKVQSPLSVKFKNNKGAESDITGSIYGHLSHYYLRRYYSEIVLTRLVKASLSSLNNENLFKELYQDNLVSFLVKFIETGSLKCYLYLNKGICKRISSVSIKNTLTNYKEVEVNITSSNKSLYNQINAISSILANLLELTQKTSELSTKLLFKGDGLRSRVSSDQANPIADLVALTVASNVMVLDSKDTIETGIPANYSKTMLKDNFDLGISTLSATTGFPMSFFSGDFGGGIASTSTIENTRLFEAKEQFFYTYLYEFFLNISTEIEPKMTLSDRYSLNEIQSFLIAFEDNINVDETLLNLGFTLKGNSNDKSTNDSKQAENKKQNISIRNI
jgi:hypothetical protein